MTDKIQQWLLSQGLAGGRAADIMDGFCDRLAEAGFPLARGLIALSLLHRRHGSACLLWEPGAGGIERGPAEIGASELSGGVLIELLRRGGMLRRRLCDPACSRDLPALADLLEAGMTDYLCWAVPFADMAPGNGLISTWATDRDRGFSESDIEQLVGLLPLLAMALKASAAPRVSRSLLSVYLGHDAGDRVLAGTVRRGSMQTISAVIYYADLAGFTRFADRAASEALIAALDAYLEAMAVPVELCGGQILKYVGDGLLATFALADFDGDPEPAIAAALDAAEEALARTRAINAKRQEAGEPFMELDIALHLGDVLYGNVGTDERLDFTVIGPAVNEASRIEALCGTLDRHVLASAALAEAAGGERHRLTSVGPHELRGVTEPRELFGLAAASPASS